MTSLKVSVGIFSICIYSFAGMAQTPKNYHLLVGTYTKGKSEGIHLYKFNVETGAYITGSITPLSNPSFLAVSKDQKYVYCVQEDDKNSMVSAFSFDATQGKLTLLNSRSSGGTHPCHVSIHPTGKKVFVGNYTGGTLAAFTVLQDGSLDSVFQIVNHQGSGINKQRQEKPHVHQVLLSPDGKFILVSDLGIDKVVIYPLDIKLAMPILTGESTSVSVSPGGGPRHIVFHPNGKFAYLVQELTGKITAFNYNTGKLSEFQSISMLDVDFSGNISGADVHISPDGKFLYASNRGDANELVIFNINQVNGMLAYVARQPVLGKTPRNFIIDPTGKFLLVANQDSDNIVIFKRDNKTGLLQPTGQTIEIGNPVCLIFTRAR